MSEYPHLNNAPIREALIDIRVKAHPEVAVDALKVENAYIRENYPQISVHRIGVLGLELTEQAQTVSAAQPKTTGFHFTSNDGLQIVQFRVDGFTFNRLKPYEEWEVMRDEAKRLWQAYLRVASPVKVTRSAVRYINVIELPLPIRDLGKYLTSPPALPEGVSHHLSSFLNRLVIDDTSTELHAILTQALESSDTNKASVILDIDAYCERSYEPEDDEIWEAFEHLRNLKNELFFKSITDATVEFCQCPRSL